MARGIAASSPRQHGRPRPPTGEVFGSSGTLTGSPSHRAGDPVDTFGRPGLEIGTRYDSLLAKVIVHTRAADFGVCATATAAQRLRDIRCGHEHAVLLSILSTKKVQLGPVTTSYLQTTFRESATQRHRRWARAPSSMPRRDARAGAPDRSGREALEAGATVSAGDPARA